MKPALTCRGAVGLPQQVGERFHQVSCKQDEEPFEAAGDVVSQSTERQQTLVSVRLPPVAELRTKRAAGSAVRPDAHYGRTSLSLTLKKSVRNVTSDSFITMATRQSMTWPSMVAVASRSS